MTGRDFTKASHNLNLIDTLPEELYTAIGTAITKYAYLDNLLQHTIFDLVGVDDAVGRLAVREPSATD